jgi:hypothetical protein
MRRGDQVTVTRKDGKAAIFSVTRVARFSKSRFPTQPTKVFDVALEPGSASEAGNDPAA